MADPLALSGYRKVYVPTSKASVVSVYTAAEVDRLLLNYMPAYVAQEIAQEIEGIDVESYFVENVIIANTMVTNVLTAQKGYIAELTVDQLDTSDMVHRYNLTPEDDDYVLRKAPVKYQRMNDEVRERVVATYAGDLEGGIENRVQCVNRAGELLYYIDATKTGITEDETDWPVWRFVYDGPDGLGLVKEREYFEFDGTNYVPAKRHGLGNGVGDNGTMTEAKWADRYEKKYITTGAGSLPAGTEVSLGLTDDGIVFSPFPFGLATTYAVENSTTFTITTSEQEAYRNAFELSRQSKVLIHFAAKLSVSSAQKITAKLYVDSRIQNMIPEQTCTATGEWMFSFQMISEILASGEHTVIVKLYTSAGTAAIGAHQGQLNSTSISSSGEAINYAPSINIPAISVPEMPTQSVLATVVATTPTYINITMSAPAMPVITESAEDTTV